MRSVQNGVRQGRPALLGAAILGLVAVSGCSNTLPPATLPASGITSSNGGGMRATGAIPDVSVSNGQAKVGADSSNPRVPRY